MRGTACATAPSPRSAPRAAARAAAPRAHHTPFHAKRSSILRSHPRAPRMPTRSTPANCARLSARAPADAGVQAKLTHRCGRGAHFEDDVGDDVERDEVHPEAARLAGAVVEVGHARLVKVGHGRLGAGGQRRRLEQLRSARASQSTRAAVRSQCQQLCNSVSRQRRCRKMHPRH